MSRKLLLVCATLALFATSAYASGVDLAFNACPGGTGATFDAGTQDCTATGPLSTAMYMVFQPADAAVKCATVIGRVVQLEGLAAFPGQLTGNKQYRVTPLFN